MGTNPRLEILFSRCPADHPLVQELLRVIDSLPGQTDDSLPGPEPRFSAETEHREDASPHAGPTPFFQEQSASLLDLIQPDLELASLPDIFIQIERVINNPRSSARDLAAVISKDPNLSAKLLKIVNSAFYGFRQQIDTVSRAVTILGHKEISSLALGTSVMALFKEIPSSRMNMNLFWKHSVACGICARLIAGFRNFPGTERFFIAGLLHDLGKLIIFRSLPRQSNSLLQQVQQGRTFYYQAERELLGFDHAQVGRALAEKWRLPTVLEESIGGHHPPLPTPPSAEVALILVADNLANALGFGSSGERLVTPELIEATAFLGLPPGIWENLIPLISRQVQDTLDIFTASA